MLRLMPVARAARPSAARRSASGQAFAIVSRMEHFTFNQLPDLHEMLIQGRERAYLAYIFDTRSDRRDAVALETYAEAYSAPGAPRAGFSYYRPIPRNASKQRSGLPCPTKPS